MNRNWPGAVVVAALLASILGCVSQGDAWEPKPDVPAHVEYDTVRIDYGEPEAMSPEAGPDEGMVQQPLVGDPSALAALTRETVERTNQLISEQIVRLEQVKALEPTDFDNGQGWWEWETAPWRRDGYTRLVIRRQPLPEASPEALEALSYELWTGRSAEDNVLALDGEFVRFPDRDGVQQGYGILRFYFDALRIYNPDAPPGAMRIAFRSRDRVRQVHVALHQMSTEDTWRTNALYQYEALPDRRGRFRYFGRANVDASGRSERLHVQAAWMPNRRGRVVARAEGGSLRRELRIHQCWDIQGVNVFTRTEPSLEQLEGGERDACAGPLLELDLEPPIYRDPGDADPAIPGPHSRERGQ